MAAETDPGSTSRLESFIENLLARDPAGRTWLPALLAATPHGPVRLGELVEEPGWIETPMVVRTMTGRLGCFEYPAPPSPELLRWYIDHPDELTWPADAQMSPHAASLRRALVNDDPPGSRAKAQDRAQQLVPTRPPFSRDWWRFEDMGRLDCALLTPRLLVVIAGEQSDPLAAATEWYPRRTRLVRDLEAARLLAQDRRWALLLISEEPLPEGSDEQFARTLPEAAPHLDAAGQDELAAAYLGNLTWTQAFSAVADPAAVGSESESPGRRNGDAG